MLVEWFVGFITGIVGGFLDWLPDGGTFTMPDFGPVFGLFVSLNVATAGVLGETLTVVSLLLTVNLLLFSFGLLRQVWRFVPIIGGG